MKILALESSAKAASVAVSEDGSLIAQYFQASGLTHSRTLLSMAQDGSDVYVLNEEGLYWYEIDDPEDLAYAEKNILSHLK